MERLITTIFQKCIHNTLNYKLLHIILLFFEYYPITLSTLNSAMHLTSYTLSIQKFKLSSIDVFCFFPFRTIPNGLNNITNIILFCVLTFFLFMFYPFMMLNNRITDLIFCNFYDLLFFRYGAFLL